MPEACCEICLRPLGDVGIEDHHLVPKTYKGKITIPIHKICHQKIHATFSEYELAKHYHTPERIRDHTEIATFIVWVQKKEPGYYTKNDDTAARKRRRKR